jgi:hypothetical protein
MAHRRVGADVPPIALAVAAAALALASLVLLVGNT